MEPVTQTLPAPLDNRPPTLDAVLAHARAFAAGLLCAGTAPQVQKDLEEAALAHGAYVLLHESPHGETHFGQLVRAALRLGAVRLCGTMADLGTHDAGSTGELETAARNFCAGVYEAKIRTLETSLQTERATLRAQIDGLISERAHLESLVPSASLTAERDLAQAECVRLHDHLARAQAALVQTRAEMAGTFGRLAVEIANLEKITGTGGGLKPEEVA